MRTSQIVRLTCDSRRPALAWRRRRRSGGVQASRWRSRPGFAADRAWDAARVGAARVGAARTARHLGDRIPVPLWLCRPPATRAMRPAWSSRGDRIDPGDVW